MRSLQKCFQVTSEDNSRSLKKSINIRFDEKMVINNGKLFLLTSKFYKSAKNETILVSKKRKLDGKASVQLEGMTA